MIKKFTAAALLLCMLAGLCACGADTSDWLRDPPETAREESEPDTEMRVSVDELTPFLESYSDESAQQTAFHYVPKKEVSTENFTFDDDGKPIYDGEIYDLRYGIDVSSHQGEIDWEAVAASGHAEFAFIRCGRRGYTKGGLFEDDTYRANMDGAIANGIPVGVYFFSQSITVDEAIEEAELVLSLLEGYELQLPVVYDWERISNDTARTDRTTFAQATAMAKAFCERIEEAGYEAMIYCIGPSEKCMFYLDELGDYDFWFYLYSEYCPEAYYRNQVWQYSTAGHVDGISTDADMDAYLTTKEFLKVGDPKE